MSNNNNDSKKQQDSAQAKTRLSKPDYVEDGDGSSSQTSNQRKNDKLPSSQKTSIDSKYRNKALTQIESSFQSHATEQGFITAKKDADRALAEDKIILNNRFVLKETLGSGGMGTVYRAQDLRKVEARDDNPFVAAKILNSDFKNHPDAFISLQREASRSHLLSHPNIVTVHDFDRDGDTIFMTMELLDGHDLELVLAKHQKTLLPVEKATSILIDFCQALVFAHKKGIIHSDLKPGNIFVTQSEGTKVLDFGIARLSLESNKKDHFDAGRIGAITPAYASLEMLGHKPPDARDDVYAAAIIAYELFAGKHPFDTKSAAVALAKGLEPERIESLSKRQWQALSKALELKRADRTTSIQELLDGLTVKPKLPIYRTITIALIGIVSWFAYNQYFGPNELNQVIDETMLKAEQCFKVKNYQCAVESANAVLEISPEHQLAEQLKAQASINGAVADIKSCIEGKAVIGCALNNLENLRTLSPSKLVLDEMIGLVNAREIEIEIEQLLNEASVCNAGQEFECSKVKLDALLILNPNHAEALALSSLNKRDLFEQNAFEKTQNSRFARLFQKAKSCQSRRDFSCAIRQIESALSVKANNPAAIELRQEVIYQKKQQRENLTKADNILKDGANCLKKLDYSCAIAKSESALVFVPNYTKALKLKRDATESLNKVKKKIEIE